ncbi:MAG: diguanylate cyclase [Planctomycetes bacterium]|nr:diguanylate cyclase [Planctomycetota bacterium]
MDFFIEKPKYIIVILSTIITVLLGIIDHLTGYEVSFSIFYLIPIIMVAWFTGRFYGIAFSFLSAAIWLLADFSSGHRYVHYAIPMWNSIMRMGFFVIIVFFITTIRRLLQEEKELARKDPLTGVPNSRYFYEIFGREVERASRYDHPVVLAYMDIDDFKKINDMFGHSVGDALLSVAVNTIRENIRITDTVARLGGDEFVILLPETGNEQAKTVLDKVHNCLLYAMRQNNWPVTFSIGVIACGGAQCKKADDLIRLADNKMYFAKNNGKNMVVYGIL